MTTQQLNGYIEQVPTPPNAYLTKMPTGDEKDRIFRTKVAYKEGHRPWDECTQEFYDEWQSKYNPQPEQEQPQEQQQ